MSVAFSQKKVHIVTYIIIMYSENYVWIRSTVY